MLPRLPAKEADRQNYKTLGPFSEVTMGKNTSQIFALLTSEKDHDFIQGDVKKLVQAGAIEESRSPRRARVALSENFNYTKSMCTQNTTTINWYTVPVINQSLLQIGSWN